MLPVAARRVGAVTSTPAITVDEPVLPDYGGGSLAGVVPALLRAPGERPAWVPAPAGEARQVVLLVVDGMGWHQLTARSGLTPHLAAMAGGPITSVVPTTTATALTSIATGAVPARHGVLGFRLRVRPDEAGPDEVLNVLGWRTGAGDARQRVDPAAFQPLPPFGGRPVPVISRREFKGTGFTDAHLRGGRQAGYLVTSAIAVEVGRALDAGDELVYAYYDGLDKTAHMTGLGEHYDAELAAIDQLVAAVTDRLPPGAALVVTADHGQVDVGAHGRALPAELLGQAALVSGEARFRWLHARAGGTEALEAACRDWAGGDAWVRTVDDLDAGGWYGGALDERCRARLGDVALVARGRVAFLEGDQHLEHAMICMHGSLTADEMWVPLLGVAA
jgi:hypothetical protein